MNVVVGTLMALAACMGVHGQSLESQDLMHRAVLDQEGKYVMLWTPRDDDIVIEVQVATKGYVGLGFSPNGGMRDADIVLGWVTDEGKVALEDRFATGNSEPRKDKLQSVTLLTGYENDTHTVLRFSRPWATCDDEDLELSGDTVRVIWAFGRDDEVKWHARRGVRSIYLQEPQFSLPDFGDDVKTWDLVSDDINLPDDLRTLYWCKIFKMPNIAKKAQIIGYLPIIQEGNHQFVHHAVLYECNLPDSARHFEKWLDVKGAQCHSASMPLSWKRCTNPLFAWAVGGDGEMLPDHVGFPMGEEHGGSTYYLMEMHYDNPNLETGVVDASGLRLFYTEKPRRFEAGSMIVGHGLFSHIIPPKADRWLSVGHCIADCTGEMIPAEGVKVVQGLLHSHLLGRELYLRQIRDGKELPMVFSDRSYDFNYQQTRVLKEEMTILPGDSFITECVYDSSDRSDPSFGGFGSDEEMCLAYLTYYPRTNISTCTSNPSMAVLLESFGIDEIYKTGNFLEEFTKKMQLDEEAEARLAEEMKSENYTAKIQAIEISKMLYGIVAKSPEKYYNTSLYEILHDEATWKDSMLLEHFQREVQSGNFTPSCFATDFTERLPKEKRGARAYPSFEALKPKLPCGALEDEPTQPVDLGEDNKRDAGDVIIKDQPENANRAGEGMTENAKMMHRAVLDQRGDYVMLWTPQEENVIFEVQVATKGYVGLGFSPNGGMTGSDIVLGWVTDDGEVMVQDRYATGYETPKMDESQDVQLLSGSQNDTHTVLRFSRPWSTCDERDFELSSDTVRIIWAIGDDDPANEGSISRHGRRGTKSMYLKEPQFELPAFSDDVQHWDVLSPNVSLPSNLSTLYWCKLYKIPPITRKTHVIGYVPVIQEGNHQHVHHILLYECHMEDSARHYEKWLDVQGAQCFGANMPLSWKWCTSPLVAWAIGGDGELMPENVGLPIGEEHGGATYFMMEIHYDNPDKKAGVVDGSGIRVFYTEKLREHDAGIMMIGHMVTPLQIVPPNEKWLSVGTCDSSCTDKELPEGGIKVFQGVLHAHLLGREITVRHIRGRKELPTELKDNSYDFNYQQVRKLKDEMTILRGDTLITECQYDATKRNVPTFGGFGTEEEMCLVFLTYYPRVDLAVCSSQPNMSEILEGINVEDLHIMEQVRKSLEEGGQTVDEEAETRMAEDMRREGYEPKLGPVLMSHLLRGMIAKAPEKYTNTSLYDILHDKETWQSDVVAKLQENVERGDHLGFCLPRQSGRSRVESKETIAYPEFEVFKPDLGPCESRNQESAGSLMHRAVMDREGKYVMLWTPGEEDIVFEVQVATKGYVGLGFSPNGGMTGSDIVLGWVTDDGEVMVQDSYATGYSQPMKDEQQNVKLLGGYQNDSHTVLRFSRPWSTCDEQDFELSSDTVRVIWAIGSEDPVDDLMKRHDQRGTRSIFLKEPQFVLPTFSDDVQAWDVLSPNVTLPNNLTTLYWCKLFKMPPITRKTHVIGYVPIVQEGNHQHVHHILLYECHLEDGARHYEKWLDVQGAQCYGANMPLSWKRCTSPLVAWAIGGEGEILPHNVGFPLGEEHGGATYFMMEIHYDNPDLKEGVVDASGIRIFHTENLREHDAGILTLGHAVSPMQIVPPSRKWLSVGHCDSSCTNKELPDSGVKVFQGLLHAHLLGRKLFLRQIRDGKELPIQLKDENYDFNYQQSRILKDEMTILPGDSLITECYYDASKQNAPSFGGFGTEEEMCLAFLSYYPRVNLSICASQPHLDEVLDGIDVEEVQNKDEIMSILLDQGLDLNQEEETKLAEAMKEAGYKPTTKKIDMSQIFHAVTIKSPEKYANKTLYEVFHDKNTWQEGVVNHLQKEVERGEHLAFCLPKNIQRTTTEEIRYPKFMALKPETKSCSKNQASPSGAASSLPPMELMHRAVLDQDEAYVMLWEPKDKEIIFEVQVRTQGYVGLGFSPNGGMKGADVVLGWVADDGKVMLQDRYATDYTTPKIDKSQDVELLGGYQNDTHTVLRFSRPLDSCDADEDRKLTSDTIRLIWAYGREDPDEEGAVKMHDERGTKSMYLMEPRFNQSAVGEDVRTWEVMSPNVTLPDNLSTLYWCKMYKIPRLARKNHIIGYVPVIQKGNEKHVHHMLLYECHISDSERHFEKWLNVDGAQCYGPNMPVSWHKCNAPIIAWAVGSEGEMFPEQAGFPLGEEHGGATYLMMEIHYDNPTLKEGVVDGSGLRIWHTERTRAHDAGVLQLGHRVTSLEVIPPRMNWLSVGHCSADCLADRLPAEGVRVFQGVLHAHLLGREISLRHIRDGQELPPVFADNNYDFNYQQARVLQEEISILRGDSFITECRYDSRKRSRPTFGGFGTEEEMCLAFLSYYPRVNVSSCLSQPSLETLLATLGVEDIHDRDAVIKPRASEWEFEGRSDLPEDVDKSLYEELTNEEGPTALPLEMAQAFRGIVAKAPEKYANMSLYDILKDEATWEDFKMVMRLQDEAVYSKHVLYCGDLSGRDQVKMSEGYPDFVPYWAPDTTCGNKDQGTPTKDRPFQPHGNKINVRKMLCPSDLSICKSPRRPLGALGNRPIFF